jgi:hypothetical protein
MSPPRTQKNANIHSRRNRSNKMVIKSSQPSSVNRPRSPLITILLTVAFLKGQALPSPTSVFGGAEELLNPVRKISPPEEWKHWNCEICGEDWVVVGGVEEWNQHLHSRRHKTREKGLRKKLKWEEWKEEQQATNRIAN